MTAPTPNAELAYKVLDHIDAHPEQHDQSNFVCHSGDVRSIAAEDMTCGTTACFAGWTVLLSGRRLDLRGVWPRAELDGHLIEVDDAAARLLGIGQSGIDDAVPHALFYEVQTRADLGRLVAEIFGPRPRSCCKSTEDVGHDFTCPTMTGDGRGWQPEALDTAWRACAHRADYTSAAHHERECAYHRGEVDEHGLPVDDVPPNAGSAS